MKPRRLLDPFSFPKRRPTWSYHHTGTLDRLISFACHSCENTGGVGPFFPFWNSAASPAPASSNKAASPFVGFLFTDHCRLTTVNCSDKSFICNNSGPQRLLLSKLQAPINHAESTLPKVSILRQLKVPLESIPFEKQGEGSPLWLTKC